MIYKAIFTLLEKNSLNKVEHIFEIQKYLFRYLHANMNSKLKNIYSAICIAQSADFKADGPIVLYSKRTSNKNYNRVT